MKITIIQGAKKILEKANSARPFMSTIANNTTIGAVHKIIMLSTFIAIFTGLLLYSLSKTTIGSLPMFIVVIGLKVIVSSLT